MNMVNRQIRDKDRGEETAVSGWWLVTKKELFDLWNGGRAMIFLILYSILLGITTFLLASNSELKLLPPREMVFMLVRITIVVSLFISLLMGADSISGERERATLEGLLLVPTSRRQIVIGKFLAIISVWPAAFLIAATHIATVSPDMPITQLALVWGGIIGTVLVISFAAFGMLVSIGSDANRTSLFVSLFVTVLFLLPTQYPGTAQTGFMGKLVKRINPMESVNQFLEKIIVNNRTFEEMASWLAAPIIFATLIFILLFVIAAPRLALDGKKANLLQMLKWQKAVVVLIGLCCLLAIPATGAYAQTDSPAAALEVTINTLYKEAKTGDSFNFVTTISNHSDQTLTHIVVAMNIVNLGDGDPVDPEDWSPVRTQTIKSLGAGETADLTWIINTILHGDYLAYLVAIPAPNGVQKTSVPVSSPGIHMTVALFNALNPAGVAPLALGTPLVLSLILALQLWLRRRVVDDGRSPLPSV